MQIIFFFLKIKLTDSLKCSNSQSFTILTCFGTLEETCSGCNVAPKLMKLSKNTNESADRNNMQQNVGWVLLAIPFEIN